MVKIITKTISIIYNIMKLLVRLYIKSFEYYPKMTTFCTIYAIVRYLFFPLVLLRKVSKEFRIYKVL